MFSRFDIDMNSVDLGFDKLERPPGVSVMQWQDFWRHAEMFTSDIERVQDFDALQSHVEDLEGHVRYLQEEIDDRDAEIEDLKAENGRLKTENAALAAVAPKC